MSKSTLRVRVLAARRSLSPEARAAAAARLQAALVALLADLPAASGAGSVAGRAGRPLTVTGYAPLTSEPGGADLPDALAGALTHRPPPGGRLLLPVLLPDLSLDWSAYQGELVPGHRGLAEPPGPRLGRAAIGEADVVVVPAVAVDRRGLRLGRGGGSYDRALALAAPSAFRVAVLYDGELVERVPAEPHDQRVTAVVTPSSGLVTVGDPGPTTGHTGRHP